MLSETEYVESIRFMQTYKDALKCVEQIAERRQAATHYEQSAKTIVGGIASKEVQMNNGALAGGENKANFAYMRAFESAKKVFDENKFADAQDRESFGKKLDAAMGQF